MLHSQHAADIRKLWFSRSDHHQPTSRARRDLMDFAETRTRRRDRFVLGLLAARVRIRRRRATNDRALALGANPDTSPELAQRAQSLQRSDTRAALAAQLTNIIHAAEEPADYWRSHGIDPPLRANSVLAARTDLLELARRLASPSPASVTGLARASLLIEAPDSPIYRTPRHPGDADLADRARNATEQLDVPLPR